MTDEHATPPAGGVDGAGEDPLRREIAATEAATRRQQANIHIKNHVLVATTLGLVPSPLFDLALLSGNQVALVQRLAALYSVPVDAVRTQALIASLLAGSAPVLAVTVLSFGAKLMPGIGRLLGSGSIAVGGGALTHAVGQVFAQHFEGGGTLLDVDLGRMRRRFARQVKTGRKQADAPGAVAPRASDRHARRPGA